MNLVQTKFSTLEEHLDRQRENHERLLGEIDDLNARLAEERARSAALTEQLRSETREKDAVEGLNFQIGRLSQENVLLKEANEKITASAFDVERDRRHRKEVNDLKLQLVQLEATLKVRTWVGLKSVLMRIMI